jgi:cobalt/nickel transport system ATP-binding protein
MAGNLIKLETVSYRYPTGTLALNGVDLALPEGKKIALLGANGAGKSTLFLLLNGIFRPVEGELFYKDVAYRYNRKALTQLRRNVGLLFQESDNQLIAPSVYEEISFGLCNIDTDKSRIRERVEKSLQLFDLEDLKNRSPHQLSAGQKKRVCLAAILAMGPELIVCDEPASNLDPKNAALTFQLLEQQNQQGKTILISTHDVNQAYEWADHIILLDEGRVAGTGTPREIFGNAELMHAVGLEAPRLVRIARLAHSLIPSGELPVSEQELLTLLASKALAGGNGTTGTIKNTQQEANDKLR